MMLSASVMVTPCDEWYRIDHYYGVYHHVRVHVAYETSTYLVAMAAGILTIVPSMDLSVHLSDDQSAAYTIITITCGILTY